MPDLPSFLESMSLLTPMDHDPAAAMSTPSNPKHYFTIFRPGGRSIMNFKYRAVSSPPQVSEKTKLKSYPTMSTLTDLDGLDDVDLESRDRNGGSEGWFTWLRRAKRSNWIWLLHAILIIASITLFALAANLRNSTLKHVQDFSAFSPAAKAVKYDRVRYNITTEGNRFVGKGPDVDQAWQEISYDVGDQWISKNAMKTLDMPESSLTVQNPKTGEDGYRIGLEVFHHIHCLNLLRKVTYKDYYSEQPGDIAVEPEELQKHTDHCLEVLRLSLTCNADIGAFTFYMVPGDPLPWPELNSKHVCRNFDQIRQWAMDNSVGTMEHL